MIKSFEVVPQKSSAENAFMLQRLAKTNGASRYSDYLPSLQNMIDSLQIRSQPDDKYALDGKGLALDNLGNYTRAILYYDKALAIGLHDVAALCCIILCLLYWKEHRMVPI
jgi:tetratricopeptide (TPR) repeat protein